MVSYVRAHWQTGDGVFVLGNTQGGLFPYYAPDIPFVIFAPDRQLSPAEIPPYQAEISRQAAPFSRLWVLAYGSVSAYDPGNVVGDWLGQLGFITFRQWYHEGELRLYALNQGPSPVHRTLAATMNGIIQCTGVDFSSSTLPPGGTLAVTIYWQPTRPVGDDLVGFTHLLNSDGALVAQHDGEPVDATRPTSSWQSGETVADRFAITLPPDLPPGTYTLQTGFTPRWQPSNRWPVTGPDAQPAGDAVRLGTLEVKP
jgi:hypothetical protein